MRAQSPLPRKGITRQGNDRMDVKMSDRRIGNLPDTLRKSDGWIG